ncbi:MAG TPA: hypothetical protein VFU15_01810, partial [Bacteroidia bacterium]|nr:hypothetical protein [Bacteroidia bacterium]
MKKFLIVSALALSGTTAFSQIDNGVPSATGKGGASTALLRNWDAIGINPANLGWADNYKFSVTVANFGLTAQSDAFQSKTLRNALISPNDTFNSADKQLYVKEFDSPNALNFQANVNWGAASFYFPKIGGFAIGVRDRMWGHVGLNQNASDLIFNGINAAVLQDTNTYHKTLGQILDSTNISYLHYRELN